MLNCRRSGGDGESEMKLLLFLSLPAWHPDTETAGKHPDDEAGLGVSGTQGPSPASLPTPLHSFEWFCSLAAEH